MADLVIYETGNGGDLRKLGNDIELTEDLFNFPYLGWFGGNPEAPTTGNELEGEQRKDWWGNEIFFSEIQNVQYNSRLEKALTEIALTSAGRVRLQDIALKDLKFLQELGTVLVEVFIIDVDHIEINAIIQQPDNIENKLYQFIWDSTKETLIIDQPIPVVPPTSELFNLVWNLTNVVGTPPVVVISADSAQMTLNDFFNSAEFHSDPISSLEPLKVYRFSALIISNGSDPNNGVGFEDAATFASNSELFANPDEKVVAVRVISDPDGSNAVFKLTTGGTGFSFPLTVLWKSFNIKQEGYIYEEALIPSLDNYTFEDPDGFHVIEYDEVKKAIKISTTDPGNHNSFLQFNQALNIQEGASYMMYFEISGNNIGFIGVKPSFSILFADTWGAEKSVDGIHLARGGSPPAGVNKIGFRIRTSDPAEIFIHSWGIAYQQTN